MKEVELNSTGSTAYRKINRALKDYEWYNNFRLGNLDRQDYRGYLSAHMAELKLAGLNEDQIYLSSRFPLRVEETVNKILDELYQSGIIPSSDYPRNKFREFSDRVELRFQHDHYTSYIFPEEAMLLYALTHIVKPKTMLFLGSYYGYWAIWALPALEQFGGIAHLVDLDKNTMKLAERNIIEFGFEKHVNYWNEDVMKVIPREKIQHDFIVLDAEGPKVGNDCDLLDKAIYYPMLKVSDPYLTNNGIVLCHNILLSNPIRDEYFNDKITYNYKQFSKFLPYIQQNYAMSFQYETTEGVGIYTKTENRFNQQQ